MTEVKRVGPGTLYPRHMVSIPDGHEPAPQARGTRSALLLTGIFTIAAALLVWWAYIQMLEIRVISSSTFQFPRLAWALWSLTIIGAGLAIGLAVASGASWRTRLNATSALWGLIPLTFVALFHAFLAGWLEDVNVGMFQVVLSQTTQTAAALAVGFFLTGLLAPLLPDPVAPPRSTPPPEGA